MPLFPNLMKNTNEKSYNILFHFQNNQKSEETQAKHHENMTDMHPINFSHKDMGDDGKQHTFYCMLT